MSAAALPPCSGTDEAPTLTAETTLDCAAAAPPRLLAASPSTEEASVDAGAKMDEYTSAGLVTPEGEMVCERMLVPE
jgi:hypothetical protein